MKTLSIREKKNKLKIAIKENDVAAVVSISKDLGISMQHICRLANVNVGNLCSHINGKLPHFIEEQKEKIYNAVKELLLDEI